MKLDGIFDSISNVISVPQKSKKKSKPLLPDGEDTQIQMPGS
jgi:hypothetical protein